MMVSFEAIQTRPLLPPQDNLFDVMKGSLPTHVPEGSVFFITSKVVAIHQGRCIPVPASEDDAKKVKKQLTRDEADAYLDEETCANIYDITIAAKYHALFPAAGIDESNANGYFICLPHDPFVMAWHIRAWLMEKYKVRTLGVVITDSHTIPMRRGTMGISIGFAGLVPTYDCRGNNDIFGRPLKVTKMNYVDAYSAMANVYLGEGDECTPIVIAYDLPHIVRVDEYDEQSFVIDAEQDIYSYLFRDFQKGGGGAQLPNT